MHSRQGIISTAVIESVRRALRNKYEEDKQIKLMLEEFLTEDLSSQELEITKQAYEEVKQRLSYSALLDGLWQEIEETQELYDQLHVYDSLEEEYSSAKDRLEHDDLPIHNVDLEDVDMNDEGASGHNNGGETKGFLAKTMTSAMAERATGSMLERATGAMLERNHGTVLARTQGAVVPRQERSVVGRGDGSLAIRPLQSIDIIRNMPIQVGDLQSQNKQDGSLAMSSDSSVKLNDEAQDAVGKMYSSYGVNLLESDGEDEVAAFDKAVAEKTKKSGRKFKESTRQGRDFGQHPYGEDEFDEAAENKGELFLKDVLELIGKVETPSVSLDELVRNTEWKEFKKLAKAAKKSLKKAHKEAKRAAKKGKKKAAKYDKNKMLKSELTFKVKDEMEEAHKDSLHNDDLQELTASKDTVHKDKGHKESSHKDKEDKERLHKDKAHKGVSQKDAVHKTKGENPIKK